VKSVKYTGALLLGVSALGIAAALAVTAQAQTPPPPPVLASVPAVTLRDVVITARHRAERAQSVPVSLTTVNANQIKTVGSSNLTKLQQLVPSLTVESFNPRNTALNIRGLGAVPNLANDGLEGGVGVYLDGVLLARPAQDVFDLPDLQDIEVLRGPQGTLFGKNTVSGAINITTRLPSFTPQADGSVSIGTQNYVQFKASASSAIGDSDKVAFRLSVQSTQHEGYTSNIADGQRYGNQDDKGVRLQILANVTPNLTVRAIFDYSHQKEDCCASLPTGIVTNYAPGYDNGAAIPGSVLSRYAKLGYTLPTINPFDRKTDVDSPIYYDMETGGASLQADYNLSGYTLTSISAARYWNWYPHNDLDDTALPVYLAGNTTDYQRQVSQELRFTSPLGGAVDYTGGLFYFYQSINAQNYAQFGSAAGAYLSNTAPGSATASVYNAALNNFAPDNNGVYDTNSFAAYGQATWHLAPKFDLTGGLRYTYEIKDGAFNSVQQGGVPVASLPGAIQGTVTALRNSLGPIAAYSVHTDDSLPAGLLTFSYKPVENILTYATYSHGSKSAGINLVASSYTPKIVAPESIDNYEAGFKTTLLGDRFLLNGDAFWDEDKNYQSTLVGSTPGGTVYTYVASIPKVRSRGFEIDSQAQVTSALNLFFSGVYDNAYNESNPHAPCPIEDGGPTVSCNLTGRPVAGVSTWTGSIGGEYDQPLPPVYGRNLVAYFGGNAIFKTGFYSGADTSQYGYVPGYGVGNIDFGFKAANGAWDLSGWIHNVTDTRYYLYRSASDQFPTYNLIAGQVGDPITGGVTLSGKF
jgi:iron complex outermembrane receptor protein